MLRIMRTSWRRIPVVPLSIATLLTLTVSASGCQRVQALAGGEDKEEEDKDEEADKDKEAEEEAEAEEEEEEPELPPAAIAVPPPDPEPLTGLDGLLAMIPEGDAPDPLVVVRSPGAFFDYATEAARFTKGPMERIGAASDKNPAFSDAANAGKQIDEGMDKINAVQAAVTEAGIDLKRGVLVAGSGDSEIMAYASEDPDAFKKVAKALGEDPGEGICKKSEASPGYVVCAKKKTTLDNYKAGGDAGVKALRDQVTAEVPGVNLDESNVIAHFDKNWMTLATRPGLVQLTTALPADGDTKEFLATMSPGPAKILRAVGPGAGFVWGRVNTEQFQKELSKEVSDLPPGIADAFDGEVLMTGHHDPSAVSLQFSVKDTAFFEGLVGLAEGFKDEAVKELPPVGDGVWTVEVKDVPVGASTARAIHVGLTGVPEADVLASMTGLTIDTYAFAANDTVTLAIGASPEAIGAVAAGTSDGPTADLKEYLPADLVKSLDAGEVSLIAHLPVDALHQPQTRNLINSALKNEPTLPPDAVNAVIDMTGAVSSGTLWVTHSAGGAQVHLAVQGIGHHADDEGKAALDAAVKVAEGGDPAAAFKPLIDQFGSSPRLAAYRARAGESQAALVASGVGAALTAGVVMFPVLSQNRNEEIATELGVEVGTAELAAKESVVEATEPPEEKAKKKKKPKKKKEVAKTDPPPTKTDPLPPPVTKEDPKAEPPPTKEEPKKPTRGALGR